MKDFNFFSDFMQKRTPGGTKAALKGLVVLAIVLLVAGAYLLLVLKLNTTQGQIDEIESYLATPSVQSVMSQANEYQMAITDLQKYINIAGDAENNLAVSDRFDAQVMRAIAAALPSNVTISALGVESGRIMLGFITPSMEAAAQTAAAYENFEYFDNVTVGSVAYDEKDNSYQMTLTADLKDGGVTQ